MRRGVLPAIALVVLAGCSGGDYGGPQNDQTQRIRIANKHHEDLTQLPPRLQRLAMMRAVRDGGHRCQRVDNAGYQEEYRNMRMWVAVCGVENKSFAVYIAPNGQAQVRDCAQAGQLSLPRCEGLPPAVPDERPAFQEGAADKAFRNEF